MVSCLAVLSVVTWAAGVSALPGRELVRVTPPIRQRKRRKKEPTFSPSAMLRRELRRFGCAAVCRQAIPSG